jgi:hypothetical protein
MPYTEGFNDGYRALPERCWTTANADEGDLSIGQSDLVMGHAVPVTWNGLSPMLLRPVEGDFVIATKVEALAGSSSDFCDMKKGDEAGLVVQSGNFRATFLLRPYLLEQLEPTDPPKTCEDDSEYPPRAIAEAQTTAETTPESTPGIGIDGEGDIAVCRHRGVLSYFYREPVDPEADWLETDWKHLGRNDAVSEDPLEVGLTVVVSETGAAISVEGHFNWVVLLPLDGDDCQSPLEQLKQPEPD